MSGDFIRYQQIGRLEKMKDGALLLTFTSQGKVEKLTVSAQATTALLRHRAAADLLRVQPGCTPTREGRAYRSRSGKALIVMVGTMQMMCPWTCLATVVNGTASHGPLSLQVAIPFQTAPARALEV